MQSLTCGDRALSRVDGSGLAGNTELSGVGIATIERGENLTALDGCSGSNQHGVYLGRNELRSDARFDPRL